MWLMVAEELMVVALIDILEVEQVVFEGGEVDVGSLPLSDHLLVVLPHQFVH